MLRGSDVDYMKHGQSKLSSMKKLMGHVIRAATVVNRPNLIKREMVVNDTLLLYHAVKHMFHFDCLRTGKKRRYEMISWKTYYNILCKRKGLLMGEQQPNYRFQTTTT